MKPIHVPAGSVPGVPTRHGPHILKEVVLSGGVIPPLMQIAFADLTRLGPAEVEPHKHDTMWEIYCVISGRAIYRIDSKEYRVGPGDFLAIPPGAMHNQEVLEAPHRIYYFGLAVE